MEIDQYVEDFQVKTIQADGRWAGKRDVNVHLSLCHDYISVVEKW